LRCKQTKLTRSILNRIKNMKRIITSCVALAALAVPALAFGATNSPLDRSPDASTTYNPTNTPNTLGVPNIGATFSHRGASNATLNIDYMNETGGMLIPATPQ
jgi:hypothetical protein